MNNFIKFISGLIFKISFGNKILIYVLLLSINLIYIDSLTAQTTYYSIANGNWNQNNKWSTVACGGASSVNLYPNKTLTNDDVVICNGVQITLDDDRQISDLTIEAGGVLDLGNKDLTIDGNLILNGTIIGNKKIIFNNAGSDISGQGTFNSNNPNGYFQVNNNITISSISLTIINTGGTPTLFNIANNFSVTNNGTIIATGNLVGVGANSTFINNLNSSLKIDGEIMTIGILTASASGNTIEYSSSTARNIKTPSTTYYNMKCSGTSTKTMKSTLTIDGNLTISSGTLDCVDGGNNWAINLKGNWNNSGTFTYGTGNVTFDGTSDQSITKSTGQTFNNLTINKASGTVTLNNNVVVYTTLDMTSGNINTGTNKITVGTATTNTGTLTWTSGQIIGKYEKWFVKSADDGIQRTFPVGTASNYRALKANLTMGGAAASGGSVIVEFIASNPGNSGLSLQDPPPAGPWIYNTFVDGYWTFTNANGINITSYYVECDGTAFTAFAIDANTRLLTRTNGVSNWTANGTHIDASGVTAKRNGITQVPAHFCFGDDTFCVAPTTSAITGSSDVCTGATGITYSVTNSGGSTYTWSTDCSDGTDPIPGQGTNSVTITAGATGIEGSVQVIENNGCTYGTPVTKTISVHSITPSSISGQTSVAANSTGKVYSVTNNASYTYTWTITGGTTDPNPALGQGTNSITVDWGTQGTGDVSVVAENTILGCVAAVATNISINKYVVIKSTGTIAPNNDWNDAVAWDCNCVPTSTDNIQILAGHIIKLDADKTIVNVTIDATGNLSLNNKNFTINGDLILEGTITGGNKDVILAGTNTDIGGVNGIFNFATGKLKFTNGNKTILSNAVLTSNVSTEIIGAITVNNYGSFTINNNLVGSVASSTWANQANSTLNVTGVLLSVGTLDASSSGNYVKYSGTSAQNIKTPSSNMYYNLTLDDASGSSIKTMQATLDVNGNLSILGTALLDVTATPYNLNVAGDWINTSVNANPFNERTSTATVTFDGSSNQTITAMGGETFNILTVNKTAGTLTLANNVSVLSTLNMTQGNIDAGANTLILGTNTPFEGTLNYTAGTIIGEFERYLTTTGSKDFPIGTSSYYRPINITINTLTTSGSIISKFETSDPGAVGLPLSELGLNIINQFADGYWNMVAANSFAISDFNVTAVGTSFSSPEAINASTRIIRRDNGGSWVLDGTHTNASSETCYRNNLTLGISSAGSGTQFGLGKTDCPTFTTSAIGGDAGNNNVCKNLLDVNYNVTNDATHTYAWSVSPGGLYTALDGDGTSSVTIDWGATSALGATLQVIESSACYTAPTVTLTINIHSLPTSAISGSNTAPENTIQGPYSVTARTGYEYVWSVPVGNGAISSGQGTNSVTVTWGNTSIATLRCSGVYTITDPDCAVASNEDYTVTVYASYETIADGDWSNPAIWDSGNVPDNNTESAKVFNNVTINTASYTIKDLYIDATGTLTHDASRDLTIEGNYYNYGSHDITISSNIDVYLTSAIDGKLISGNGYIFTSPGKFNINGMSHDIASGSDLYFIGDISLGNSINLKNYGSVYITGNLNDAGGSSSSWYNFSNSILQIEGTINPTLYANSNNNTVYYAGAGAQFIKTPNSNQYWHLNITTDGIKTMQASLNIDGNLTIDGNASLDVSATNYTINIGGNWTNSSTNGTPFNKRSGTVVFDGNGNQTISNSNGETFYRLTIASQGNILRTDGNLTITNLLTLTKGAVVITNPYLVICPSGSSTNGGDADSFVDGVFKKIGSTAFTFPLGNSTSTIWAPLGIENMVGAGVGDEFEAQYYYASAPDYSNLDAGVNNVSAVENWDLSHPAGTATSTDVLLYWKDADRSGIDDIASGDLIVAHYNGVTSLWEDIGGTIGPGSTVGAGGSGYVKGTTTSFSRFSHGSKGSGQNPLPIELLFFDAQLIDQKVKINWVTVSEINNDYYIVQKSTDFNLIEDIEKINGAGNSVVTNNYVAYDNNPFVGISYYRISQIDYEGTVNYSKWITINNSKSNIDAFDIYPNPIFKGSEFYINYKNSKSTEALIVVRDILGNELYSKVHIISENNNSVIAIDLENKLPSGIYIVVGTSENKIYNKKIVLK